MTRRDLFWGLGIGWFLVFQAAAWAATDPPAAASVRPLDLTAIVLAIIGGIPVTIAAVTGLVLVMKKQDQVINKQDQNAHTMNHRLDELVAAVEKAALAKGEKIGAANEKAAAAERALGVVSATSSSTP